jgi:hypothetical protein
VGIVDPLLLRGDDPRAGLDAAVDHELAEAEKLVQILFDAGFRDEGADRLARVDQPFVLQLGQGPPHRRPGRPVLAHERRFRGQPGVRGQAARQDVVADRIGDPQVHGAGVGVLPGGGLAHRPESTKIILVVPV